MLTKEAIELLAEAQSIKAASDAIYGAGINQVSGEGLAALPNHYTVHDLEKELPNRRRARGSMTTSVQGDFSAYVTKHQEEGAAVFVDQRTMSAIAVLNLGTPARPGHADNTATLALKQTAAYKALLAITSGPKSQVQVAEFLEDWTASLKCEVLSDDGETEPQALEVRRAVAAVRKITIEGLRRLESEEKNLSASRSLMEQVQVKNEAAMPTKLTFTCEPFLGLGSRPFAMRLSVLTTNDKPSLQLRIVNHDKHDEEMAEELASSVRGLLGPIAPVHIGSYTPSK